MYINQILIEKGPYKDKIIPTSKLQYLSTHSMFWKLLIYIFLSYNPTSTDNYWKLEIISKIDKLNNSYREYWGKVLFLIHCWLLIVDGSQYS